MVLQEEATQLHPFNHCLEAPHLSGKRNAKRVKEINKKKSYVPLASLPTFSTKLPELLPCWRQNYSTGFPTLIHLYTPPSSSQTSLTIQLLQGYPVPGDKAEPFLYQTSLLCSPHMLTSISGSFLLLERRGSCSSEDQVQVRSQSSSSCELYPSSFSPNNASFLPAALSHDYRACFFFGACEQAEADVNFTSGDTHYRNTYAALTFSAGMKPYTDTNLSLSQEQI